MPRSPLVERSGGIVVWKPVGCTSRAALERVEERLAIGPLGHTGTLDPLACGVLVLLGGEARKLQGLLTAHDKEYQARVALGMRSSSDDAEGPLWSPVPRRTLPSRDAVERATGRLVGDLEQRPPALSAVRVAGERAHRRARRGELVEVPARRVRIDRVEVTTWNPPVLCLEVSCGPGTYVRSLARDLGEDVGVGGVLVGLRRTRVGAFEERHAVAVECAGPEHWLTVESLARGLPRLEVDSATALRLGQGQRVRSETAHGSGPAVAWCEGRVFALVEMEGELIRPRRALHAGS